MPCTAARKGWRYSSVVPALHARSCPTRPSSLPCTLVPNPTRPSSLLCTLVRCRKGSLSATRPSSLPYTLIPALLVRKEEILNEYTKKIKVVIEVTLKAMAKLLDLEEDYFIKQIGDKATTFARFNYYPRCSRPDLVLGIKSHSDGSRITILLPDQMVDGLEVLKDGQWVNVHAIPYALIINVGDQMEIMSNGIFKSPVHRVVTNSEKERISLVMFLVVDGEKEIGPADELIDEDKGQPRLYKKLKVKEYLEVYYRNSLQGKRSIDWAKV